MKRGILSTSYRRRLLDKDLITACAPLKGTVIDLGGEWKSRRGSFRPPQHADINWLCLNLDPEIAPDLISDVAQVPLSDACADAVVCTEVLEHVPNPERVLMESYRLLRQGGKLIVSMPFMAHIHGDPHDYQRYTATKLKDLLSKIGFQHIDIQTQGLYFTVLADLIRGGLAQLGPTLLRWPIALLTVPLLDWLVQREQLIESSDFVAKHVAGYFIFAYK